jgi:ribonucleoside-triphosphate reductase
MMDVWKESLETKSTLLEKLTTSNLYPYTTFCLKDIRTGFGKICKTHFSTIGLVGINEVCSNFSNQDITSKQWKLSRWNF